MSQTKHALADGDRLPDLILPGVDGKSIHIADYRGRRLFMFMWASW